jgi:hypothetical protein
VSFVQVHATEDSHYILVPIIDQTVVVKGWVIYDCIRGEVTKDEPFQDINKARSYLSNLADGKDSPDG